MKKSKMIFTTVVAVILIFLLIMSLITGGEKDPDTTAPSEATTNSSSATSGEGSTPDATAGTTQPPVSATTPETTIPAITVPPQPVGEDVSIQKVEKDPNEIIDRTANVPKDHPEYIKTDSGNPYFSSEGKVFRNDKIITIDIYDRYHDVTHKVSFGYITGQCNRFLYLNPHVESPLTDEPFLFKFGNCINGGAVMTFSADTGFKTESYTMRRTLDQKKPAAYHDPQHPGTIWFSQAPLTGPCYLDVLVMSNMGDYIASIRITIEKDTEDGTYSITDLTNRDLYRSGAELHYTEAELDHIVELANQVLADSDKTHFTAKDLSGTILFSPEKTIIEIRNRETGLYYNAFVPMDGSWVRDTRTFIEQGMPILAVTGRDYVNQRVFTLYFQIYAEPKENSHGEYYYIGRDYHRYDSAQALKDLGYTGTDL